MSSSRNQTTSDALRNFGLAARRVAAFPNFTIRKTVIEHSAFSEGIRKIAVLHSRGTNAGVAEGLLIYGQTGSGKSTAFRYYASRFPPTKVAGHARIPVVTVTTPESPTVKTLAEVILTSMGDPAASSGTANTKTARISYLFKRCNVELLLIDEFQHFSEGHREVAQRSVTDWLKNLFNVTNVPVVLAGLPRAISVINANSQLRRRFSSPWYLKPFEFNTEDEQQTFRAVLKGIHCELPVQCPPLHEANIARRFFYASNGLIDYVVKIIDTAVSSLPADGVLELNMESFATAFRQSVWREAPEELNPFSKNALLRPLTRFGEPFDIWDDPAQYTAASTRTQKSY